jgi:antitoxin component YwqK of YwqJK toxin-antitoxin module
MNLYPFLLLFVSHIAFSQNDCEFKYQNKKGGNYLFSIYYETDLKTPLNGTCERRYNDNRIFEKRTFIDGKLMEEILNYESGSSKTTVNSRWNPRDTVIATMELFWENGNRKQTNIYYWDKNKRRCEKYTDYHLNGKIRFVNFNAFARLSEINEYDIKDYPPHTIDYDGYTTLRVPFGLALEYDDTGVLKSKTTHKMLLNGGHEHASREGLYEDYHHNGKLKTKGNYKEGDPDGNWIIYNFLGKKIEEQYYQRNMKVGTWKGWHDNGKDRFEHVYDTLSNFIFHANKKEWNEAGLLVFERFIDRKGSGLEKKWDDRGTLMQHLELVYNSKEQGSEKNWYPNGQLKSYLNNHRNVDTTYVSYFQDGKMEEIHLKTKVELDQVISTKKWNEKGVLISAVNKKSRPGNEFIELFEFWETGKTKSHIYQLNETRLEEKHFQNGSVKTGLRFLNSKLDGKTQHFDSLGNLLLEYNYTNNLRNGWCKRFDKTGKLLFAQYYENGCPKKMTGELPAKKRNFEELTKDERESFISFIYNNLSQYVSPNETPLYYTKKQVDSIASYYLYLFDTWSKYAPFPFPTHEITSQVISFRLPAVYLTGLVKGDTTDKYVKEVVTAFEKNGWRTTQLKSESGYYNWDLKVEGFYTQKFIQKHFPLLQSFIYISPQSKNVEPLETFHKVNRSRPLTISLYSDCVAMASSSSYERTFQFLIYSDGEVDLLNGISWEDINDINDFSRELPYD